MKIKEVEIYQNGDKWVIAWKEWKGHDAVSFQSQAFPSKTQAKEFKKTLKV